jgi:membrane protease YdiL (CAAX protease family)
MEPNKITLKTFTISVLTVLILEFVFRLAMAGQNAISLPAMGILRCLEAILVVFISFRFEKSPGGIGLSPSTLLPGILKGFIWSACFGIAAGLLFLALFIAGIDALKLVRTPLPASPQQIVIFFLVGGLIGPVAEEIFFRGIIYGFFRRWGVYAAAGISTLFFVIPHNIGNHIPITQMVGGIVFAVAYERERSLMVPITIHTSGNLAIFSLMFIAC